MILNFSILKYFLKFYFRFDGDFILYPIRNLYRHFIELPDFWDFQFDFTDVGINEKWSVGFEGGVPIAVPASWNEQFAEDRDFLGPAWYQTKIDIPNAWKDQKIFLRFGSVNYLANIWINGENIGVHEGGHLPFEFDISDKLNKEDNILVVRVDGRLSPDHVPPRGGPFVYPSTNFDFFPYCGIHRPVILYSVPNNYIKDITVITEIHDSGAKVNVTVDIENGLHDEINFKLEGHGKAIETKAFNNYDQTDSSLNVENPKLWTPDTPNLYDLTISLLKDKIVFDSYTLSIGIRTIEVKGDNILLNGDPIYLNGFGRHEDFPIIGRGYIPAVIIKDYSLMKWVGANSFRTSHYPYSDQMMDLADRLGFLVIDEIPAVGLTFDRDHLNRHLELCSQYIKELISRDRNHPSVIAWSLANEPTKTSAHSKDFFRSLYDQARTLDPSRLITLVNMHGVKDWAFEFCDIVCLNRYYGWYLNPGEVDKGLENLSIELDKIHKLYQKPIILSEFGADTIPGVHAQPPEMFSEEYQVEFFSKYIELLNTKDYIVGAHVWNLCDFKTGQGIRRMGGFNYKGVFTRDRKPKMAAHHLRKLWNKDLK
jgi:beta-glucuronidase